MKNLINAITITLASVAPALAAGGNDGKGTSILLVLFLGFAALIVVFQFIPGLVLFASMIKGLFASAPKKTTESMPGPGRK